MPARPNFGKRSWARTRFDPPEDIAPNASEVASIGWRLAGIQRWPLATIGLLAALWIVFTLELTQAQAFEAPWSPDLRSIIGLGGVSGYLTFGAGEWWRIFTAPFLHGSYQHISSNSVSLLIIGVYLERKIGHTRLFALFFIAALGGGIQSLSSNSSNVVSVGASSGILGLMAAGIFLWFKDQSLDTNDDSVASTQFKVAWLQRMMIMVALATLPALMGHPALGGTDYAGHLGGAIVGGALGFASYATWDDEEHPPFDQPAASVAVFGISITLASFAIMELSLLFWGFPPTS